MDNDAFSWLAKDRGLVAAAAGAGTEDWSSATAVVEAGTDNAAPSLGTTAGVGNSAFPWLAVDVALDAADGGPEDGHPSSETAVVMLDSGVDDAVSSLETTAGVDIDFFPWLAVDLLLELRRFTFGRCAATQVLNFSISVATSLSMILPPLGVTGAWRSDTTGFTERPSRPKFISLSGNPVNPYLSRAVRASLSHILAAPTSVLAWNPIRDFAS